MQQLYEEKEEKKESQKKGFFKRFGKKAYKVGLHGFAVFGIIAMFGLMIVGCHTTNKGQTEKPKSALKLQPKKTINNGTNWLTIDGKYGNITTAPSNYSTSDSYPQGTTSSSIKFTYEDNTSETVSFVRTRYQMSSIQNTFYFFSHSSNDYPLAYLGGSYGTYSSVYCPNSSTTKRVKVWEFSNFQTTFNRNLNTSALSNWKTWLASYEIAPTPKEYTITTNLTNCTWAGDSTITEGETASGTLTASTNYTLTPAMVSVTGATATITQGAWPWVLNVALSNPTGNVTITATAQSNRYQITPTLGTGVTAYGNNPTEMGNTLNYQLIYYAGYGYEFEKNTNIPVTNATGSTSVSNDGKTLTLELTNPTGNVSYSVNAKPYPMTTFTFTDDYNPTGTSFTNSVAEHYGYANSTMTKCYNAINVTNLTTQGTFVSEANEYRAIIQEWTKLNASNNDYFLDGNWKKVTNETPYIWVMSGMWYSGTPYALRMTAYEDMPQALLTTLENARTNIYNGELDENNRRCYYVAKQIKIQRADEENSNFWGTTLAWQNRNSLKTITYSTDGTHKDENHARLNIDGTKNLTSDYTFTEWLKMGVKGNYSPQWGEEGTAFSIITAGFTSLTPLLNIAILPGISLGLLLFIPLVVMILIVVIKMLKK